MIRVASALIAIIFFLTAAGCDANSRTQLPSRSDCIVRINVKWPANYNVTKRESIIDNIGKAIGTSAAHGGPHMNIQAAFPRKRRDVIYIQFGKDCEHRLKHAHDLIEYLEKTVSQAPVMQVSDKTIKPGNDTINAWGPQWKDGGESG